MPGQEATDLLLQAANAIQADQGGGPLSPGERMALRYFARANRFSRSERALAEFQAIDLNKAEQLVRELETGGYLIRAGADRRFGESALALTERSRAVLADDPYEQLLEAVDSLEPEKKLLLCQALRRILGTLAEGSAHWYLNSCRNCSALVRPGGEGAQAASDKQAGTCTVFNIEIAAEEMSALCINFNPSPPQGNNSLT